MEPSTRKPFKSVIIDDNVGFTMALQLRLERMGHEVEVYEKASDFPLDTDGTCPCRSGESCGDFLIIDQQMPDMTGLQFVRELSQCGCLGIFRNTVLISGWLVEEEEQEARELGCEVFHKPFEFQEIYEWIEEREKAMIEES